MKLPPSSQRGSTCATRSYPTPKVTLPVDRLAELWPRRFRGARIGALLHAASIDSRLHPTLDTLEAGNGRLWSLTALFGPQHGLYGHTQENMIEWQDFVHPRLGIPVYSLYGATRKPTPSMLQDLDILLVDLQEIGVRYYTYLWTLYLCMEACQEAQIPVVVCDRPNPLGGVVVEGPILQEAYRSFVGLHPLPIRHGKTIGELSVLFRVEAFPECRLVVLPMSGWKRTYWFEDTGIPWVPPSPNIPWPQTALVYTGMALLEATNISEGRGTTRPFEFFGSPWIDPHDLCQALNAKKLPGVYFREAYFEPAFHKYAGKLCGGAQLHVLDRHSFKSFDTGIEVINTIRQLYPEQFQWRLPAYEYEYQKLPIEILLGGPKEAFFGPDPV
ncbi:exo-beta-N-acetylmuramidase NamZ family protein [Candidatus Methylacidithermus pantelleriae]|nr:DUF1343 domain-containing protein [Candidatus Methylacidithermus pantelleriae]